MTHLITHLKAKGFMGKDINEPIAQKTIFTGNNTVGKSTRANLIAITILGFSPFSTKTNKKSSDILNDFGDGKKMITEITCGGVIFERKFTRSEKGSVSNKMRVDNKGATKSEFDVALSHAGSPKIIDLNDFLGMSDTKGIDSLFSIYPPGADLTNLDSNIEKSKKKISRLNESIKDAGGAIKKLIESKTAIELPAGTLAETQKSIEDLTKGVLEAQNALKIAEKKNNEELLSDQKQRTDEAYENAVKNVNSQAQADKTMEDNTVSFPDENNQAVKQENAEFENHTTSNQASGSSLPVSSLWTSKTVIEAIQEIITTMEKTDCTMCAGLMMAKMKLRKFKGGVK